MNLLFRVQSGRSCGYRIPLSGSCVKNRNVVLRLDETTNGWILEKQTEKMSGHPALAKLPWGEYRAASCSSACAHGGVVGGLWQGGIGCSGRPHTPVLSPTQGGEVKISQQFGGDATVLRDYACQDCCPMRRPVLLCRFFNAIQQSIKLFGNHVKPFFFAISIINALR